MVHSEPGHEEIDIHTAQPGRMVDFIGGGTSYFSVDRDAVEDYAGALPGGVDAFRAMEEAVETFRERAVRYLVAEAGMRQFLVLDVRVPGPKSVHRLAQELAPESRAVYLVSDPVVLAHAHELQPETPEGTCAYVTGRVDDPETLLREAAGTLDLSQPVAVMLLGVLTMVRVEAAGRIVAPLIEGVPPGSHMVVTGMASDVDPDRLAKTAERYNRLVEEGKLPPLVLRDHATFSRLFDGLALVEPGVVPLAEWSRGEDEVSSQDLPYVPVYAAVAHK